MQILFFLLLMLDSAAQMVPVAPHDINLPAPPIGGTKADWIGYGISVGVTVLIGLISRFFEQRKMKKNFQDQINNLK